MSEVTQVEVSIMGRTFTIGTPVAERETLLDAVRMLNEKADAIRNMGKIVDVDKIEESLQELRSKLEEGE